MIASATPSGNIARSISGDVKNVIRGCLTFSVTWIPVSVKKGGFRERIATLRECPIIEQPCLVPA